MSVDVVPYDPRWPHLFAVQAAELEQALATWLVTPVQHVGSTAVPGLGAKPVLDLVAGVASLQAAREALPVLVSLGWTPDEHRPHEALWAYRQPSASYADRTAQLHLTEVGSALWCERLAFRDALRADEGLRDEYAALKAGLASRSLAEYTQGKRAFVARVLAEAGIAL